MWAEPIGIRVAVALAATSGAGATLVVGGSAVSLDAGLGAFAVVVATLAWAGDNVYGRPLADRNPARVVLAKGALGAALSVFLACAFGDPWPRWPSAVALVACGAGAPRGDR